MSDDLDRHPFILLVRFVIGILTLIQYLIGILAFLVPVGLVVLLVWGWIDNNVVTH